MEKISILFSSIAVLISFISLIWTIHIGRRDRGNIKTSSEIIKTTHGKYLHVKAINHGRRPVILTRLGINFPTGLAIHACGEMPMLRLGENEAFEEDITNDFIYTTHDNGEIERALDIWVEDTLGRRYRIEGVKQYLRTL